MNEKPTCLIRGCRITQIVPGGGWRAHFKWEPPENLPEETVEHTVDPVVLWALVAHTHACPNSGSGPTTVEPLFDMGGYLDEENTRQLLEFFAPGFKVPEHIRALLDDDE